jgi:hypothetical protein
MNEETVEDAAEYYYPTDNGQWAHPPYKDAFKKGAEWQKEQLAIDAIEFAKWKDFVGYVLCSEGWIIDTNSVALTDKQLYDRWKSRSQVGTLTS